ncbi:MAG: class I SAM-dependent methyltransferase [Candidatus Nanoarchaeia archaeon]|nr:class I SAM-dependent methyltransferase [Candidatus Nanoarchaeia archaeon]
MKATLVDNILKKWRLKKAEKLVKGGVVYDIGCYHGEFLKKIEKKIEKGYGIDKLVNKNSTKKITFKKAYIKEKIPGKENSADYLTMIAILEHLENPEKMLKDCRRILKKGGLIIITTPHPRGKNILEWLVKLRLVGWGEEEIKDHKGYYDEKAIEEMLKKAGFGSIRCELFEFGLNVLATAKK